MLRFIIFRLMYVVVVLLAISVFIFGLSRLQGDPRNLFLDAYATPEQYAAWGRDMGLDKPLVVQYWAWLSGAVRGDFGRSLFHKTDALGVVVQRIPATLQLSAAAFIVMILMSIPLGVLSAVKRGSPLDYIGRTVAAFGQALPGFWIGLMLILIFAVQLGWLPTGRRGGLDHYILPALSLGTTPAAGLLRLVRSAMLETLGSEYIKLARAKGVSNNRVIWKHALRNATIPPLTFGSLILAGFLTGAVVNETVFAWPGLGRLAVLAINTNDFPVLIPLVLLSGALYLFINLVVDITYALVDPRIRLK
ncbi:MAG: ABC transporter permease [Chloroflexi bacterium]|nr:ABC transporter permease [Chloroflexota bacterium]